MGAPRNRSGAQLFQIAEHGGARLRCRVIRFISLPGAEFIDIGKRMEHYSLNCAGVTGRKTRGITMLNFPNDSRSFDRTRRAVRFWGYDSSMEASFFVTEAALKELQPNMRIDEPGMLDAFDSNRDRIYAAAAKVYARGRKGSYDLERSDF
jgi:hypothetical protein